KRFIAQLLVRNLRFRDRKTAETRGWLESGRRARRDCARNCRGNRYDDRSNFKPVCDRNNRDAKRRIGDNGTGNRAHRAGVRSSLRRRHVCAEMELRPHEDNREEQRQKADPLCSVVHVLTKTKLRADWLQGQAKRRPSSSLATRATIGGLGRRNSSATGADRPELAEAKTYLAKK